MAANAVVRAKELVRDGKIDEGRKLLLEEGFVSGSDPSAQKAYFELIPPTRAKPELKEPLRQLSDSDAQVRYEAIRAIAREMFAESAIERAAWASDPRTTAVLIGRLQDGDKRVVEQAAGTLAVIIGKYFADLRAFEPLAALMKSGRRQTRVYAVSGIGGLAHPARWDALEPALSDNATEVRRAAVRKVAIKGRDGHIPKTVLPRIMHALRRLQSDTDAAIRTMAAAALEKLK